MAARFWLIPLGAIAGSAAVLIGFAVQGTEDSLPATAIGTVPIDRSEPGTGEQVAAPGAFSASLAAHDEAAATSNVLTLERMIESLAAEPDSVRRDAQLNGLLAQLASLDPLSAAQLARDLDLGDDALITVFQTWAASDADEALFEIGALWPPATQRAVALSMLDVFGANETGIERIAEAFAPVEATSFRIDAIGRLARLNFDAAIAAADKIEVSATQTIAQQRIADVMAGIDPLRAFEYGATIVIPIQRQRFMDRLVDGWAQLDPDGMFAFMEMADLDQMTISANGYRALATTSPEKLLGLAAKLAPAQRAQAQAAALEALTALDPLSAYDRVSSLPPSSDRDRFINTVAGRYAQQNPEAALAWVTSLEPRSSIAFNAVLSTVAADNPTRVADAVIAEILNPAAANRADMPSLMVLLSDAMQARSPEIAQIASTLASHPDPRVRMQLNQIIQRWPQADPEAAVAWIMQNPSHLSVDSAQQVAQILAAQNPALARQSLQRIPENLRGQWIQGAASGMARSDLDGTLSWIETFRGEATYQPALDAALMAGAASQPEKVVDLLDRVPEESRMRITSLAASAWASRDPEAAAEWVSGMPAAEQATLGGAAGNIASQWADRDPRAAQSWVLGLPSGPARDEGLSGLIQASANRGSVDTELFERFSSADARSRGVMNSMFTLGRSNPDLARQLIADYVSDPAQRAQAEQMLESASRLSTALTVSGLNLPPGAVLRSSSGGGGVCIRSVNGNTVVMTSC